MSDVGNLADFDDESPAGTLNKKVVSKRISELASSFGFLSVEENDINRNGCHSPCKKQE